ncbi:unnamed protein product [Rangifer tarandus platyrhynchus]|uniref:Uncharacterized protein n=2 Tax=Rangifer tarandus platyrhynchus TaxID=3082113 RepID=A0ABN8ZQQ6_RANTA|nr:unnamed protein product [Rangifer tarandus platyrhynchus]CAI9711112.1 unnamed protein product [Rangifer tarandus platyrhynchus]
MLEPIPARLGSERAQSGRWKPKRPAEGAPGPLRACRWAGGARRAPGSGLRLQSGSDHSGGRARYPSWAPGERPRGAAERTRPGALLPGALPASGEYRRSRGTFHPS